jgi:hypothetical protein
VNSLSDIFHKEISDEVVLRHFEVFAEARWQEFRALTKRAERLVDLDAQIKWTDNVAMGVTCEDAAHLYRIAMLGKTGAIHKFISFEPFLSPWPWTQKRSIEGAFPVTIDGIKYRALRNLLKASGIFTCLIGGESSRDKESARYFDIRDAAYLVQEAEAAGALASLKQLGTRWAVSGNTYSISKKGGDRNVWPETLRGCTQQWPYLKLPSHAEVSSSALSAAR